VCTTYRPPLLDRQQWNHPRGVEGRLRLHLPTVLGLAAGGVIDPLLVATGVVDRADAAEAWLVPHTKSVLTRGSQGDVGRLTRRPAG
jgi:hypothetical protein